MATASTSKAYHPYAGGAAGSGGGGAAGGSGGGGGGSGSGNRRGAPAGAASNGRNAGSASLRAGSSASAASRRGSHAMSVASSSHNNGTGPVTRSGGGGGAGSASSLGAGVRAINEVIGGKVQEVLVVDDDDDDDDQDEAPPGDAGAYRRPQQYHHDPYANVYSSYNTSASGASASRKGKAPMIDSSPIKALSDDEINLPPARPLGLEDATYQPGNAAGSRRPRENGAAAIPSTSAAAKARGRKRGAEGLPEQAVPPPAKASGTMRSGVGAARLDEAAMAAESAAAGRYMGNNGIDPATAAANAKRKRAIPAEEAYMLSNQGPHYADDVGSSRKAARVAPQDHAASLHASGTASYRSSVASGYMEGDLGGSMGASGIVQAPGYAHAHGYMPSNAAYPPPPNNGAARILLGGGEPMIPSASTSGGIQLRYRGRPSREPRDAQGHSTYKATSVSSIASPFAPSCPPPGLPIDDKEGHFIVRPGDTISGRFKILSQLGQGTFGKVVECWDRQERRKVAIKVIRAIQKYRDASQIEIRVLRTLRDHDPDNQNQCIHLLSTFSYRNHVCIVSELLGKSVFDFLKENEFHPFPATHIWSFARQLLKSVAFLHSLNLVHTDLKPENILLVDSDYVSKPINARYPNSKRWRVLKNTEIRLIDFGSATFDNEYHSAVVSTRHYRAPEIILGMGWSFPCDAWSIGCILVEFHTGEALFQTHDNLEHLAMMEAVLGPMPSDFERKSETYKPELFKDGRLDYPNSKTSKSSKKFVKGMGRLHDLFSFSSVYNKHNTRLLHLIRRLLEFDPEKRITVQEALNHPYFSLIAPDFPP